MTPAGERRLVAALVAAGLALRLALGIVVAPFQAPDEASHLRFVQALLATGRLPVQPAEPFPHWEQYYQPPLAYLVFTPLAWVVDRLGGDETAMLHALRAENALWGAATVTVGWAAMAVVAPPGDPRRVLVPLVLATLPGFAGNSAFVNDDALANLLAALLWLPLLRGGRWGAVAAGLVFGAACLSKLSVLALAPLLLAAPLLARRVGLAAAVREAAVAGTVAVVCLLPWMVRNVRVYGDPLAIGVGSIRFEQLAHGQLPPELIALLARPVPSRAFVQFWGRFGIYNNAAWPPVAGVWVPLAALAAAGWLWRRGAPAPEAFRRAVPVFAATVGLALAGLASFSLRFYGAWQGRYLYTTMLPIAALLAGGWTSWLPARAWPALVVLAAAALVVLDGRLVAVLARWFAGGPRVTWGLDTVL